MTNQERLIRSESILRRQSSGKITKWEASAEFDRLLDECGDLHYYSDTTCMRGDWAESLMIFPHRDDVSRASNTGIITQGPNRGKIVTRDREEPNAHPEVMKHFSVEVDRTK